MRKELSERVVSTLTLSKELSERVVSTLTLHISTIATVADWYSLFNASGFIFVSFYLFVSSQKKVYNVCIVFSLTKYNFIPFSLAGFYTKAH